MTVVSAKGLFNTLEVWNAVCVILEQDKARLCSLMVVIAVGLSIFPADHTGLRRGGEVDR